VNLINYLCAKNGTERANICKLQLSLQPRFIARFNQLVSITSQTWGPSKPKFGLEENEDVHDDERGEEEGTGEIMEGENQSEEEYDEYDEADENADELQVEESEQNHVKFQEHREDENAPEEDGLTAAEEDELYEENDDSYDATLESTEAVINDDDVVVDEEFEEEHDNHEDYIDDIQGEEERQEQQIDSTNLQAEQLPVSTQYGKYLQISWLMSSDSEEGDDDDDLISYEEAVDQAEGGQDYRQQYLNEEDASIEKPQYVETNSHYEDAARDLPRNGHPSNEHNDSLNDGHASDSDATNSKRTLDEVVDPSLQDQEPRKRRRLECN
jgi:hypothetical protein